MNLHDGSYSQQTCPLLIGKMLLPWAEKVIPPINIVDNAIVFKKTIGAGYRSKRSGREIDDGCYHWLSFALGFQ